MLFSPSVHAKMSINTCIQKRCPAYSHLKKKPCRNRVQRVVVLPIEVTNIGQGNIGRVKLKDTTHNVAKLKKINYI